MTLTSHRRDLSNKEFNNNDTRGPKSVSTFITKLSEFAPRLVIKQMTLLIKQLDSEVSWRLSFFKQIYHTDNIRLTRFGAPLSRSAVI